jgi:hypothetical protein
MKQPQSKGSLRELHDAVMRLSDPMQQARRMVNADQRRAEAIEQDALASGAMRGDFRLVLRLSRPGSGGHYIRTELA